MIYIKDYENELRNLGIEYFIHDLQYVPDLMSWAKENNQDLGEPHHPMKLIDKSGNGLTMVMQSEISDEMLNDVIKNLSIRWSLQNNTTDIDKKLNSTKKRLVFCFLKECARTMKDVGGDNLVEDKWVFNEMENLDFFNE